MHLRSARQSAHHGGSCCCTHPVLLLPAASAEIDQAVSVVGGDNKTCARFHQQPTGLLQQSVGWCHWSTAAHTASDPECRCSLVTRAKRYEYMTPVLRSLHWLPVRHLITFKTAVTVYKCLHGLVPPYRTEYYTSTSSAAGRRHLRSAYTRQLIIARTRTSYGDRTFAVHGPIVWNSLPYDLRSTDLSDPWPHLEID